MLAGLTACGDGHHAARPTTYAPPPDLNIAAMQCVDVTNYEQQDYSHLVALSDDNLVEGDHLTDQQATEKLNAKASAYYFTPAIQSVEVIQALAGITKEEIEAAAGLNKTKEIRKCIAREIRKMESCGKPCETYWGGQTWILTRTKAPVNLQKSNVEIVPIQSCEQIQKADCLLTN